MPGDGRKDELLTFLFGAFTNGETYDSMHELALKLDLPTS
jgi:hypothetical protein